MGPTGTAWSFLGRAVLCSLSFLFACSSGGGDNLLVSFPPSRTPPLLAVHSIAQPVGCGEGDSLCKCRAPVFFFSKFLVLYVCLLGLHVCLYTRCVFRAHTDQKRAWNPRKWVGFRWLCTPHSFWELHAGPLQEQVTCS